MVVVAIETLIWCSCVLKMKAGGRHMDVDNKQTQITVNNEALLTLAC